MNKLYKYSLKAFHLTENTIAVIVLCLLSLVPVVEIIARSFFKTGLYGSTEYVQHLVIWITFVGGMFASREKRHLSVALGAETFPAKIRPWISTFAAFLSVGIVSGLAIASYIFITVGMDPTQVTGIIKTQYITFIMPLGFALMALRFIGLAPKSFVYRFIATLGFGLPFLFIYILMPHINLLAWPLGIILGLSLVCGTPIFVVLGGIAQLVLLSSGGETATLANEAYSMLTGPLMPTIPLFSLAGYILSESKAGERLVRLFQACFGWMSGGLTIMAIMVSAFFTTFTGASGVTVIALGGLLTFILMKSGYQRGFSLGFVTASGSLGLLFPPSIAVILYGVVSHVNIRHMFVAGLLPGFFIILVMAILGSIRSKKSNIKPIPFQLKEALLALKESAWEILLPVFIMTGFFMGFFTMVETSAIAVVYVVLVEVFIKRDISLKNLPGVLLKCVPIVGGVLIILASAKGLSYCVVDAEIPYKMTAWVQAHIHSKYTFLLLLNVALLLVGCFMDIFSAIIVVVPLIAPLGIAFGINPVHLGVIFLTNLEIGYLMPPVGINLSLASYRFNESLPTMYRHIFPFVIILFAATLAITYLPFMSTWLVHLLYK